MNPTNPRQRKARGTSRVLTPPFFVISDTHWFHKNIVKYCNRDMNHNQIMIDRWNATVGPDDYILHLGDVLFCASKEKERMWFEEVGPSLNGRKFLILGNHDKPQWEKFYNQAGFNVVKPFSMRYRGYDVSFDHYPTSRGGIQPGDQTIRIHGHIHNKGYQHIYEKRREKKRYGNVNVSVEVIDYTPQPIERMLDKTIEGMKPRQQYYNVNGKRNGTRQENRHAA